MIQLGVHSLSTHTQHPPHSRHGCVTLAVFYHNDGSKVTASKKMLLYPCSLNVRPWLYYTSQWWHLLRQSHPINIKLYKLIFRFKRKHYFQRPLKLVIGFTCYITLISSLEQMFGQTKGYRSSRPVFTHGPSALNILLLFYTSDTAQCVVLVVVGCWIRGGAYLTLSDLDVEIINFIK